MSGCGGDVEEEISTDGLEYITHVGTLQSLGNVNFSANATHIFRVDGSDILYVYSDDYNLNDSNYLNQKLEAGGFVFPSDESSSRETFLIEELSIMDEEEEADAGPQVAPYSNNALGFSLMVRDDWDVEEGLTRITFTAPTPEVEEDEAPYAGELDTVDIRTMANAQELPIMDWYLEYILPEGVISPYTESAIGPESLPAIRADIKSQSGNSIIYYIADGTQVYIVTHKSVQNAERLEYSKLFSDLLFSFDPLSDGEREVAQPAPAPTPDPEPVEVFEPATVVSDELGGSDYQSIITSLEKVKLSSLIPQSGFWTATRYDFVEPDYIYIIYSDANDREGRVLVRHNGGQDFERLASFDEGVFTDWSLSDGVDEAKGKAKTSINASSGSVTAIPEGYRAMESGSLNFQMYYPASWFYSRSGSFYYFSDEPADADNALASLEVVDSSVSEYKVLPSITGHVIQVPRDDSSSFRLDSSGAYSEQLDVMASSIVSTNP
jgi:hypothetical protein